MGTVQLHKWTKMNCDAIWSIQAASPSVKGKLKGHNASLVVKAAINLDASESKRFPLPMFVSTCVGRSSMETATYFQNDISPFRCLNRQT